MKVLLGNSLDESIRDYFNVHAGVHGLELLDASLSHFYDEESFSQILDDIVPGEPVVLIQSTGSDSIETPDRYALQTLIMIRTLKRYGAGPVWLIEPYSAYSRQDKTGKNQKYSFAADDMAFLKKQSGADGFSTIDLHSQTTFEYYEGYFGNGNVYNLDPSGLYVEAIRNLGFENIVVGGPDGGADARAQSLAGQLNAETFKGRKKHDASKISKTEMTAFFGDVKGKSVIEYDDIMNTCGTMCNCARTIREHGAKDLVAVASHGTFGKDGLTTLFEATSPCDETKPLFDKIIVSNAVAQNHRIEELRHRHPRQTDKRIEVVNVAPLLMAHIANDLKPKLAP